MRFLYAAAASLIGLVLLGIGIGQLNNWIPEVTHTVEAEGTEEAPFTIVTEELIDEDRNEFTIEAEGEYTLALGRTYDIEAWVGDAAHNRIGGYVEGDGEDNPSYIDAEFVDGESQAPNPVDSDLWVETETIEGDLLYRWSTPDESGDWALLIFRDGEEAAPAAVTTTETEYFEREGVWWVVAGGIMLLIALVLFYWAFGAPRRQRQGQEKAPEAASLGVAGEETQQTQGAAATDTVDTTDKESPQPQDGGTSEESQQPQGEAPTEEPPPSHEPVQGDPAPAVETQPKEIQDEEANDDDDPSEDDMNAPPSTQKDETKESTPGSNGWSQRFRGRFGGRSSFAALTAMGLGLTSAIGISAPAQAEETEEPDEAQTEEPAEDETNGEEPEESPDETEQTETPAEDEAERPDAEDVEEEGPDPEVDPDAEVPAEGYSVLLDAQLDRILADIAETVETGDAELDAELLGDRVAADALQVREYAYRNHEMAETSLPAPIGTDVLAAAVTSESEFPRQAVVITDHEELEVPQILVLEQAGARENYKLIHSTLMTPGSEFPPISAEQGGVVPAPAEDEDAALTPRSALSGMAQYFSDSDDEFGADVAESIYIDSLHSYYAELEEDAEATEISFPDSEPQEDITALELPDGSTVVAGSFDMVMEMAPLADGDTIFVEQDLVEEMVGTDWTTFPLQITSRESVVLLLPPEGEDGEVALLGVHDMVTGAQIDEPEWFDGY